MKKETEMKLLNYNLSPYKHLGPYTNFEQDIIERVLMLDIMALVFTIAISFMFFYGLSVLFTGPSWLLFIITIMLNFGIIWGIEFYVQEKLLEPKRRMQENAERIQEVIKSSSDIYVTVKPNMKTWAKECSSIAKIDKKADVLWWIFHKQNDGKWFVSGHRPVGIFNPNTGETNLRPQFLSGQLVPDAGANLCVVLQTLDKKRPFICSEFEAIIDNDIIKLHSYFGNIDEDSPVVYEDLWISAGVVLEDIANRIYTAYKPYDDEVNGLEKYALKQNNPKHQDYVRAWEKREKFIAAPEFQKIKFGPITNIDVMKANGFKYAGHDYLDVHGYIYGAIHSFENEYFIVEIHQVDNKLYDCLTR